jgi:uncharacterized membrane protein YoaK (UPF0700 family)
VNAALLAFVAGFVDVVGFVALFGLFTAHVTGNFVMIGVELVSSSQGVLAKILALPAFILAVAGTKVVVSAFQRIGQSPDRVLLLAQACLLALFLFTGLAARPITSGDAPLAILTGLLGVAGMGIQNAMSRLIHPDRVPTTIMTGNTTQAIIDLVDILQGTPTSGSSARERLRKMIPAIITFASGAILGAFSFVNASFWCLLIPIAVLFGLAVTTRQSVSSKSNATIS